MGEARQDRGGDPLPGDIMRVAAGVLLAPADIVQERGRVDEVTRDAKPLLHHLDPRHPCDIEQVCEVMATEDAVALGLLDAP